jgi:hypothetical protein
MVLKEMGGERINWSGMVRERDIKAVVNTVMNLRVP